MRLGTARSNAIAEWDGRMGSARYNESFVMTVYALAAGIGSNHMMVLT